jgi:putative membrane protein
MEGAENMSTQAGFPRQVRGILQNKKAFLIILFHFIGLVGLIIPFTRPLFLVLVPWHLLFMLVIIASSHDRVDSRFLFFALLSFIIGFSIEWLGVHKHWLFGNYQYGKTLGYQLFGVPLIIGVNWFLLTYSAGVLMQRSRIMNALWRIISGAFVLLLLDILIEPVAVRFDYWHWVNGVIPLKNYVCWFFVSMMMLLIFEMFRFKKQGIAGPVLLVMQFVFFGILCIVQTIFLP